MIGKRKRATEVAASIAQGGHVNFTRFSVHLHFSRAKVICKWIIYCRKRLNA